MRVALLITKANESLGGAERYTAMLARSLAARGHEPHVIAAEVLGFDAVQSTAVGWRGMTRAAKYRSFVSRASALIEHRRFDVVHAMTPFPNADVYHPHACIQTIANAERWTHRFNGRRMLFERIERAALTSPNPPATICLSRSMRADLEKWFPAAVAKSVVIHNGIPLERFDPADLARLRSPTRQRFGFAENDAVGVIVAQNFRMKGLAPLLDAFARFRGENVRLLVVGRDDAGPYAAQADRKGISPQVTFAGALNDVRPALAAADFFVLPSFYDPFPLAVLEAMAAGLPPIVSKQNGTNEVISHGVDGFVVDSPERLDQLESAIRSLLDADTRRAFRERLLARRVEFSLERHVDQVLDLYWRNRRT